MPHLIWKMRHTLSIFDDAQDLVAHTIEVIPENEKAVLSQSIAEYPSFRSAQAVVPYEDTSINTGTLQAF